MNIKNYFDMKNAAIGAGIMGGIVYLVNSSHETSEAITAGAKQTVYTFLVGGAMMKLCENIVNSNASQKVIKSIVYPTLATVGLTYGLHSLKGTPEPELSTLPTAIIAPIGFSIWQKMKKRKLEDNLGKDKMTDLIYAEIGKHGIMAGESLEKILIDTQKVFGNVSREEIKTIDEKNIPHNYYWSIRALKESQTALNLTGTHLLIRNYERTDGFRELFPELSRELVGMN